MPGRHGSLKTIDLKHLTKADIDSIFHRMDVNGNGGLSLAEIDKAIVELYPGYNHKPALMRAYKAADTDGNGFVTRREFKKLLHFLEYFNDLWGEFEQIDTDGDRRLTLDEFAHASKLVGHAMSPTEAAAEFKTMDENDGGLVLFDEFCVWCAHRHLGKNFLAADEAAVDQSAHYHVPQPVIIRVGDNDRPCLDRLHALFPTLSISEIAAAVARVQKLMASAQVCSEADWREDALAKFECQQGFNPRTVWAQSSSAEQDAIRAFAEAQGTTNIEYTRDLAKTRSNRPARKQFPAPTKEQAHALFDRMDGNGNGKLSLAEIDKAVTELYPDFDHKPALMRAY
eukprot:SAG31_NODE_6272_length_2093_cov_4.616349_2_plen_340_part_01